MALLLLNMNENDDYDGGNGFFTIVVFVLNRLKQPTIEKLIVEC